MLLSSVFLRFFCKFSMKIIFYLPVNTNNPKFVAFLVFVCTTASFLSQISPSENVLKQDAILSPVAKQWIATDIPSYGSQWKRAKIAIHWFGKYYILITGKLQETTGWREACQLYCKIAFAVSSSETTTSCSQLKRHRSLRPIPQSPNGDLPPFAGGAKKRMTFQTTASWCRVEDSLNIIELRIS